MEAVVLAGGMGTRLKSVVKDAPKPMADINGKPFLHYLLKRLKVAGAQKIILSVGYRREVIQDWFGNAFEGVELAYAVEDEPLGTGGAIKLALSMASEPHALVLNGDSFFNIDLAGFLEAHRQSGADATLALKPVHDSSRYGTVKVEDGRITAFLEKAGSASGLINGGIYALKRDIFLNFPMPQRFSFETDFLPARLATLNVRAYQSDGYFIDIGVPEDYFRAARELGE